MNKIPGGGWILRPGHDLADGPGNPTAGTGRYSIVVTGLARPFNTELFGRPFPIE